MFSRKFGGGTSIDIGRPDLVVDKNVNGTTWATVNTTKKPKAIIYCGSTSGGGRGCAIDVEQEHAYRFGFLPAWTTEEIQFSKVIRNVTDTSFEIQRDDTSATYTHIGIAIYY